MSKTEREREWSRAIYDRSLSHGACRLYHLLDTFADGKPTTAGISRGDVLFVNKASERTLKKYFRELVDEDYLRPVENQRGVYEFTWAVRDRSRREAGQ